MLNSLIYDYPYRIREPLVIETRTAWDSHLDHTTDDETLWPALWQANQAVAQAYDLDHRDLAYILQTFPGMAKKRVGFVEYIQSQISYDSLEGGM